VGLQPAEEIENIWRSVTLVRAAELNTTQTLAWRRALAENIFLQRVSKTGSLKGHGFSRAVPGRF